MKFSEALIVVDVQNDFCRGGALPVPMGDAVIPVINRLLPQFGLVIAGMDWHPANHCSFVTQGGPWPPHCVQFTQGAELHPDLEQGWIRHRIHKGTEPERECYSDFGGVDEQGHRLDKILEEAGVGTLYVTGLATDYCVRATTLDARVRNYRVYVVTDAIRAVNVERTDGARAVEEMIAAGAGLITSRDFLRTAEAA